MLVCFLVGLIWSGLALLTRILAEVVHDVLDDARLQNVRNVDFLCELRHQGRLAHAAGAADQDHKGDALLVETGHQLITRHQT